MLIFGEFEFLPLLAFLIGILVGAIFWRNIVVKIEGSLGFANAACQPSYTSSTPSQTPSLTPSLPSSALQQACPVSGRNLKKRRCQIIEEDDSNPQAPIRNHHHRRRSCARDPVHANGT
jgi:hypothetical protein